MGNCLIKGERVIKVTKPDGKIIEYRSPIRVLDLLSEFSGHAVSETSDHSAPTRHVRPETMLRGGNMYYLVPIPLEQRAKNKKKVRFSEPEKDLVEEEKSRKVVRIKLVISKQELQELLKKGGVSINDVISQIQTEKRVDRNANHGLISPCYDDHREEYWKPVLESIPEVN